MPRAKAARLNTSARGSLEQRNGSISIISTRGVGAGPAIPIQITGAGSWAGNGNMAAKISPTAVMWRLGRRLSSIILSLPALPAQELTCRFSRGRGIPPALRLNVFSGEYGIA